MIGATKMGEYYRTIEMLERIAKEQGVYYVIAFLYDSQYDRQDIKNIMTIMESMKKTKKEVTK